MRRFLIHLAIALVAFIVGVTAATVFGGFSGLRVQHRCAGGDRGVFVAPPPVPAEHRSCPAHRFDIPAPPLPPAPPDAPKSERTMRIHVRAADGTVKEVEIKTDKDAEQ
ncbi:MAG TPA: hypothetical protein VE713_12270 [Pyrinomonadaceae bacterium]|nr:hypothetical protein [Pyrinomonadaceae bacterium]